MSFYGITSTELLRDYAVNLSRMMGDEDTSLDIKKVFEEKQSKSSLEEYQKVFCRASVSPKYKMLIPEIFGQYIENGKVLGKAICEIQNISLRDNFIVASLRMIEEYHFSAKAIAANIRRTPRYFIRSLSDNSYQESKEGGGVRFCYYERTRLLVFNAVIGVHDINRRIIQIEKTEVKYSIRLSDFLDHCREKFIDKETYIKMFKMVENYKASTGSFTGTDKQYFDSIINNGRNHDELFDQAIYYLKGIKEVSRKETNGDDCISTIQIIDGAKWCYKDIAEIEAVFCSHLNILTASVELGKVYRNILTHSIYLPDYEVKLLEMFERLYHAGLPGEAFYVLGQSITEKSERDDYEDRIYQEMSKRKDVYEQLVTFAENFLDEEVYPVVKKLDKMNNSYAKSAIAWAAMNESKEATRYIAQNILALNFFPKNKMILKRVVTYSRHEGTGAGYLKNFFFDKSVHKYSHEVMWLIMSGIFLLENEGYGFDGSRERFLGTVHGFIKEKLEEHDPRVINDLVNGGFLVIKRKWLHGYDKGNKLRRLLDVWFSKAYRQYQVQLREFSEKREKLS